MATYTWTYSFTEHQSFDPCGWLHDDSQGQVIKFLNLGIAISVGLVVILGCWEKWKCQKPVMLNKSIQTDDIPDDKKLIPEVRFVSQWGETITV